MRRSLLLLLSATLTACTAPGAPSAPTPTLLGPPTGLSGDMLTLINEVRTQGTLAGEPVNGPCMRSFTPGTLRPLTFHPYAQYMAERHTRYLRSTDGYGPEESDTMHPDYFGERPIDRWNATQKLFGAQPLKRLAEKIAAGQASPEAGLRAMIEFDNSYCWAFLNPDFTGFGAVGVNDGLRPDSPQPVYKSLWVAVLIQQ